CLEGTCLQLRAGLSKSTPAICAPLLSARDFCGLGASGRCQQRPSSGSFARGSADACRDARKLIEFRSMAWDIQVEYLSDGTRPAVHKVDPAIRKREISFRFLRFCLLQELQISAIIEFPGK